MPDATIKMEPWIKRLEKEIDVSGGGYIAPDYGDYPPMQGDFYGSDGDKGIPMPVIKAEKVVETKPVMVGYHTIEIPKGVYGEISKIEEEIAEVKDAHKQQNKIMTLVELSDLYGAIEAFVINKFPGSTMEDLRKMSDATKNAFATGHRTNRDGN